LAIFHFFLFKKSPSDHQKNYQFFLMQKFTLWLRGDFSLHFYARSCQMVVKQFPHHFFWVQEFLNTYDLATLTLGSQPRQGLARLRAKMEA
jgi:hypothetical protein